MISSLYPGRPALAARPAGREVEEEVRPVMLRELSGALDFRVEYEDNKDTSPMQTLQQRRTRYEEVLDLRGRGSVYHPNLLEFDLRGSFGPSQEFFRGDFEGAANTIPYQYDADLNFLQRKPYRFSLFANRAENTISRQFFEPIKMESDYYGGYFTFRNDALPLSLRLSDSHTREDSSDYRSDRSERTAEFRASNRLKDDKDKDLLQSDFSYTYKDLTENVFVTRELSSHSIYLNNTLQSGRVDGLSAISYDNTSGDISTQLLQMNESFSVNHTDRFTTFYDYNFSKSSTDDFSTTTQRGDVGLHHRLYDSLVTELKGEISQTEATDSQEFYRGAEASVAYRKAVPGGRFSAGYNFLYRMVNREAPAGVIRVVGERIVLLDSRRTFLSNPNVVLSSVVVRDVSGLVLLLDIDYRLIIGGNLVEIQRVNIPDNTPVLVDYEYSTPPTLDYDVKTSSVNLRYDFQDMLSFYYGYLSTRQERASGAPRPEDANALPDTLRSLYGAELRWRWFTLGTEYEDDSSDLNPFSAWRVRGSFSVSPTYSSRFGLSASNSRTEYKTDGNIMRYDTVDALFSLRLNTFLETEIGAGYLSQQGRDMDVQAWRLKGEVKSRFRAIEVRLRAEYLKRRDIYEERDNLLLRFNITRYFNIL